MNIKQSRIINEREIGRRTLIGEYPNISNYVRDVYQTEGVRDSVNMWHIKTHYFTSHPVLNANAIVPAGPDWDLDAPHDRARFTAA